MMDSTLNHIDLNPLIGLGLTNLEAEIYAYLLAHSPATGYGIAKGIAKPTANTYKALESLQTKGAIIIDDSKTRLCRAVQVEELFGVFQRRFDGFKSEARSELGKIDRAPDDSRIYQLTSTDQVISRFRGMFAKARRRIVLDFFPLPAEELRKDILAAAKRGVSILAKLYQPIELPGVDTMVAHDGPQKVERWPGQWANGVFDGEEYLLALLSRDGGRVHQAVWSNNQYLSWIYYSEIIHELMSDDLERAVAEQASVDQIKEILTHYKSMFKLEMTGSPLASGFFGDRADSGRKRRK